ncbi:MAG: error-prone DNA polymerase [Gammaproteobacteria bacterium]|nr:error-prone DNA polymerase [Gammaproteobacteria bacterium]
MSTDTTSFGKTPEAFQDAPVPTRIRDQVPLYLGQRGNHFTHRSYAELHCVSNYSFLRGASHPEELVQQAYELGYEAIAITDECSYSGLVKAHKTAKACGIKLICGAEFVLDEAPLLADTDALSNRCRLILLAPNRQAYGQISSLISKLRKRSDKGTYYLTRHDLQVGLSKCLGIWICEGQGVEQLSAVGAHLQSLIPRLWIGLGLFHDGQDLHKTACALTLSSALKLPIVAVNDVHTHCPERQGLQNVVSAIRLKTDVHSLGYQGFCNAERTLRPITALQQLYPDEMLAQTVVIADLCQFNMDELRYEYPEDLVPPHLTPSAYLRQLTYDGANQRWPDGIPDDTVTLIEKELDLIAQLHYEHYFLTVQDIVQFARSQQILCQGRGSAANSAVCYCLFITEVDPARMHLLFERFISMERQEPPDIDVDFEHERREEVIQYIYKRYGRDRAALAATLITYRPRSAIRDVGKALGLDQGVLDLLSKSLAWWDKKEALDERLRSIGLDPKSPKVGQFLHFFDAILGFPRHLSQHVGGFVISAGPLAQLVPIENASMPERTVIQWDKEDLETLGLLKIDVLALGMLTAIRKALALVNFDRPETEPLTIQKIPAEDPDTYAMLQRGDSVGVFQVESRAQMAMLPRLKPHNFYDLVIEVAIVRPGPIQGDMVHPYLRRRQGLEPVSYASPDVRKVLERTLGIPIFQEQVIELAMVAAGFSAGEADQLRRAMAAWKKRGGLDHFEAKLVNGMLERGHDEEFAQRIFNQMKGFGDYGFPESHAASFALLVYISAWLKCHQPGAFYCGLLNSLPMGFYSPSQLIQDAQRHQIEVRPLDVGISQWDHTLESPSSAAAQPALRLGLRMIKGLSLEASERIMQAQQQGFRNAQELARLASLDDQQLGFLARSGALYKLAGHRHQAHWDVTGIAAPLPLERSPTGGKSCHSAMMVKDPAQQDTVSLHAPSVTEDMFNDYRYTGLTLGPHPMTLLREHPELRGFRRAVDLEECRTGQMIRIAGVVTGRQRPGTASGVVFLTLEDETGNTNMVIWASVMERFRAVLLQGQLLKFKGVVEREGRVIHVVAGHVENGIHLLEDSVSAQQTFKSRDFH